MDEVTKKDGVLTLKKIAFISLISILLNIPLMMVQEVINERDYSRTSVKAEISRNVAESQLIDGPRLIYTIKEEQVVDDKKEWVENIHSVNPHKLESDVNVSTETLHRSIYDRLCTIRR